MAELAVVSCVWAFSFGLIKGQLAGLDASFVAFVRLALALLVLLPFLRPARVPAAMRWRLAAIGALQFGAMYVLYIRAYAYLKAYEVALLTIFTPLLITLFDGLLERRLAARFHVAALLAIAGAAVILWRERDGGLAPMLAGVLLMQGANVAFGLGQLLYRRAMRRLPGARNREVFALPYAGGAAVALIATVVAARASGMQALRPTPKQMLVLAYLGLVASGLCFFLWNRGARKVSAGALAVWNNGYIPIAVLLALLLFGEEANLVRLGIGTVLMAAALRVTPAREAPEAV